MKPARTDYPSDDQRGCWKLHDPRFKPGRRTIILIIIISYFKLASMPKLYLASTY